MTQETFAAVGMVFTGLLVIGLVAIGICTLVATLNEWLHDKRWSTEKMLETQRALMEAHNRLNERVKAIEDELSGDAE